MTCGHPDRVRPGRRASFRRYLAALAPVAAISPVAAAQDMGAAAEEQVRRATVMVITEVPGSRQGGTGTGEFINRNGLLLTNNHVVDPNHGKSLEERARNFNRITLPNYKVVLDSGTEQERFLPATLLHQSESGDMALLQVEDGKGKPLSTPHYLSFIPDGPLAESQKVWIFGFPGGRSRSANIAITAGLVTNLIRTPSGALTYVETDATAHPGNSGGPVVDVAGRLYGVCTHKRFGRGEKDRSGAVPAALVQRFILGGFEEGRIPETADLLPLVRIFTDHNGIVEFPTYQRVADEVVVYWRNGNVRRGLLKDERLDAPTVLGDFDVPLDQAAYLFVRDRQAVLIMDGGDRLAFPVKRATLAVEFAGRHEEVALNDLELIAFPQQTQVVDYPSSDGVIVTSQGSRLGLSVVQGTLSIAGGRYPLEAIVAIEPGDRGRATVRTAKGERIEGLLRKQRVRARTVWSSQPVEVALGSDHRVMVRPVRWMFFNARGRRLSDRLDRPDDDVGKIAALLDSPDWQQAGQLLEQADQVKRRSRESKRQLRLCHAAYKLRSGDLVAAGPEFVKLSRKQDAVGWVAQCYASVLTQYPDGKFMGTPLTEPDTFWRASSQAARRALAQVDTEFDGLDKLAYRKRAKALKKLEQQIDTANRLEIGIAQSKLMQVLEKAYFAHIEGYEQMRADYKEIVAEHNRARNRIQQHKYTRKITTLEGRLKKTYSELERLYDRLQEEAVGFVVEPPKADR